MALPLAFNFNVFRDCIFYVRGAASPNELYRVGVAGWLLFHRVLCGGLPSDRLSRRLSALAAPCRFRVLNNVAAFRRLVKTAAGLYRIKSILAINTHTYESVKLFLLQQA
jgi:hypothetical protein